MRQSGSDPSEVQSRPGSDAIERVPLAGPIVMKFGGTSVADADAIMRVVGDRQGRARHSGLPPVVIVSAMSGVTDRCSS